jgi:hypothetical protein
MKPYALIAATLLALCVGSASAQTRPVTVIELFTSQGCSSCPPSNDNLAVLAKRPDVLALSFGVTYWDYLGWSDTFASPANNDRQVDYVRALRLRAPYTPQMVINGRADTVGGRLGDISRIARSLPLPAAGPSITTSASGITLGASAIGQGAGVWLVRYDPRTIQVPVQRGENTGKTLPHTNVVRELVRVGTYQGRSLTITLPARANPLLKSAILVQSGIGGPIVAAQIL